MADVGGGLPRLETHHDALGVDRAERINHDLALDGLDGIDHDGDGAGVELLEGLRCVSEVREWERRTCCVFTSTEESQQPKPGCEWYQPTTISGLNNRQSSLIVERTDRPVCLSMSSILVWNTGSTASTDTPVPDWGIAKTSAPT